MLRSLAFSCEDQSILINGYYSCDKSKLSHDLLSALLSSLEQQSSGLGSSILLADELLSWLTLDIVEKCDRAVVVSSLNVNPKDLLLTRGSFSCLLLDTSHVSSFKVLIADVSLLSVNAACCLT